MARGEQSLHLSAENSSPISDTDTLFRLVSFYSAASEPARGGGLTFSPRELSSELVSVAVEWQDLGLRLGLQPWQLSRVEHEHSSCRERLAACLDAWVRSKEGASWGDVVASLKEMGEHALAMKVEDGHCGVATRRPGEGDARTECNSVKLSV